MNQVEKLKLKNAVERVLHVQGNYTGGVLEMAVIVDTSLSVEEMTNRTKELAGVLKSTSDVFRNVRLNLILWNNDADFEKEVTALPVLQMGTFFKDCESHPAKKNWDGLLALLKKFYARSKLVLLLTDSEVKTANAAGAKADLQPFLHRKLLVLSDTTIKTGTEIMFQLIE